MKKRLPLIICTGFILALSAVVLPSKNNPYSSWDQSRAVGDIPSLYGIYGEDLGEESFGALGGTPSSMRSGANQIIGVSRGLYKVTLGNTHTNWEEEFLIGIPDGPIGRAPLLVLFHGYGETPTDLLESTDYFTKARARGWYVIAPLGAHKFNFGIEYSQRNVEQALNWVASVLPIDVERLYGVGFSMGGGGVTSYAARHQDRYTGRFAAVVNHTGTTSLPHGYALSNDTSLFDSELMFGGGPDSFGFDYLRASTFDLDPVDGTIDQETDMIRNLTSTPVRTFAALSDPVEYLLTQCDQFDNQLALRGGVGDSLRGSDAVHDWNTMDEDATLDWLTHYKLGMPEPLRNHLILADRSGRWHGFSVLTRDDRQFTPFTYHVDPRANRLYILGAKNMRSISVNPRLIGLNPDRALEFVFGSSDIDTTTLILRGVTHAPIDVERNTEGSSQWMYDPNLGRVLMAEPASAGVSNWRVHF
ncbi:MAG: putative esterase [Planctomycetota bacterium]|jgi:predicted esterase